MKKEVKTEKNRGRIEKWIAYVTEQIEWLESRKEWKGLICIGTIHMLSGKYALAIGCTF